MSSALSNAIIMRCLPFIIQKQYCCSTILMWSKHFYSYCIFNTFDKIRVFVRTINLFIHLASDLYMIHLAFSRTSPNSTPVTDVHCTNLVIDNKRSRNDQKKSFKNTFKNRELPTILTIWSFQQWNRTKFRLSDKTNCSKLELVCITKQLTGLKCKKTGHRFHVIWMLQNRLSVIFRELRGHEFLAHSISCPELNSRIGQFFECDGSCNHYRGQDPEASLVFISGAKQTTASGPTIARIHRSFVLHRQHKLGWPWRRLPLLSSHAGYWKYDKSEILQLEFEFCSAQISGNTCKPWKLRNLFSTSWTSCERRNLTAKHFILNDELGGRGGGWAEGERRGTLRKNSPCNSLIRKVNNRAPLLLF